MTYIVVADSAAGKITALMDAETQEIAIEKTATAISEGYIAAFYTLRPAEGGEDDWVVSGQSVSYSPTRSILISKQVVTSEINDLRDVKKALPILSEGYQVDPGTLSTGSMAVEIFAHSKSPKNIATLTCSGNVATAVFDKNHHLKDGVTITVSGVTSYPEFNVPGVVTVVDKKTVTYPIAGAGNSPADGSPIIAISTIRWITSDDQTVFVNADDFEEVFQSCTEYLDNCQQCARNFKDEVIACNTVEEIEAINITTGWPDTGL